VNPAGGFATAAEQAMRAGAARAGLDARDARLIRVFGSAVYHLPRAGAVVRVASVTSPDTVARLAVSVQVTRWLAGAGFPSVEPLDVPQPLASHGCALTFWRYVAPEGPEPGAADLGRLLRDLHRLGPPPADLPAYQPMGRVRAAIDTSPAIDDELRDWLLGRCDQLVAAYGKLSFGLPAGMIHGDAWRGNLLRGAGRVILADWDNVCTGPREVDLIPTMQAARFGLADAERAAFADAYGTDIRSWDGYPVLRDMRELSSVRALLRDGHASPAARRELAVRLRSVRTGDDRRWTTF
jgi:Phosphotransferase enzyme family